MASWPEYGYVGTTDGVSPAEQDDSPFLNLKRQRSRRERTRPSQDSEVITLVFMALQVLSRK